MLRATIGLNYVLGSCVTRNPRAPVGAGGFFMPQEGERMIRDIIIHVLTRRAADGPPRGRERGD